MPRAPHTVADAHRETGLHVRTIQRYCRERRVAHCRTPGGRIRFTNEQLEQLVATCNPVERYPEVHAPNPAFDDGLCVVTPITRTA